MEPDYYPCGPGYSLIGDICEPTPEGYVETRSRCEMGVDSMEAAGVEQDYAAEIEKCRNAELSSADGISQDSTMGVMTTASDGWSAADMLEDLVELLLGLPGQLLEWVTSAPGI